MIIITGASRGIGKFLMDHFLNEGNEVIGFYNATEPTSNTEYYYKLDISNDEAINDFITNYGSKLTNIILINAAGISYNMMAHKADMLSWKKVIETNVFGLFNLTKSLLTTMRNDNYGRVINFSSVVAQQGVAGTTAYATSKAALWGLTKSLTIENASRNISINNINLGYFDIGMIEQVPDNIKEGILQKIPAKRLGEPKEILSTINFIINTPYLNGASIDLNGGLF